MDEEKTCQDGRLWPKGHGCVNQIKAPVPGNHDRVIGICDQCGLWLESRLTPQGPNVQAWFAFGPITSVEDADRLMGTT